MSRDKISREQLKKELHGITLKEMIWDLTKQIRNLDTRETMLQKTVAKLEERVQNFVEGEKEMKKESKIRDRFIAGLLVGLVISLIQIGIELWRMSH